MDSSDLRTTNSTGSQSSDIADNSSMIVPSKRDIFLSTYRRQNFTLPDSMMHYIAKNPKNANVYQKMIKRCKYFFVKNPAIILPYLRYYVDNEWKILVNKAWKNIDMNKLSSKLWITDALHVDKVSNNSLASSIIPNIYQCDFKYLILHGQVISLNELNFLCSSVEKLTLNKVTVKNGDGTVVAFEKLIKQLPKLKSIFYNFANPSNNTSKNTFKELWKISHLSNYDSFKLFNIPEELDVESFYSFMKKNKKASVILNFSDQLSEESKTRLEAMVDEIIGTKNHEYKVPLIQYPGLARQKNRKLYDIYSS